MTKIPPFSVKCYGRPSWFYGNMNPKWLHDWLLISPLRVGPVAFELECATAPLSRPLRRR
ncbi:hypothetical protein [Oscillatoria acuminata]|uniref:hypothetical protein n=1 Tax=Oscillatoria acuminata TaxID=118323 RepID=UPI0012EA87AB|nr:hypothetical protein [Oscillatoria acuminata]